MKRNTATILQVVKILIYLTFIISIQRCSQPRVFSAQEKGPIFIQVHFTNMAHSISSSDAADILNGKIKTFRRINGSASPIQIYVDGAIESEIRKAYPELIFKVRDFKNTFLKGNRAFLGISDLRGLSPWFKTLYINNCLPWGTISDNYSLKKGQMYPLNIKGAHQWNSRKHITIVNTGVTAMTRRFVTALDRSGNILDSIKYTKAVTVQADIAVTSNEVSFTDNCIHPLPDRMLFCSPLSYFEILKKSGFDAVELTGNHNNDYGRKYNTSTINKLKRWGILYYGGGKNQSEALQIKYKAVKGITFGFIGFNQWGPPLAWATKTGPGAARLTRRNFAASIRKAAASADVVFVSVQWGNENNPVPHAIQKKYFRDAADMGALIMISSSSHRPMGIEFHGGKFISYGLGNFLFDQMQTFNHRSGLMARHHFYGTKHIETELIPYLIFNHSQPRPVKGKLAENILKEVFKYSRGEVFRK